MPTGARRIGILAGGGSIPREIAQSIAARGDRVFVLALEGEADQEFSALDLPVAAVGWGQIGRMIRQLRAWRVEELLIVGRVRRPDLAKVRPDFGLVLALPMIWRIVRAGGDDAVLREVIRFFEGKRIRVVGPGDVAPELLLGHGPLGSILPGSESADRDIALGLELVARLGPFDVGQAAVVCGGVVEDIEGVDGTDAMLARVSDRRRRPDRQTPGGPRGVLVKCPKPGQELRIDLPAIGPETVTRAAAAGLGGIAVVAGRTIAAERPELVRRADETGLFVVGTGAPVRAVTAPALSRSLVIAPCSGAAPSQGAVESAEKGARVIDALSAFSIGFATVVVGRHVLAVQGRHESACDLVERAARLRQWGNVSGRRRGVAVLRDDAPVDDLIVAAAARAGLEGIVVLAAQSASRAAGVASAAANGMFVAWAHFESEVGHAEVR